MPQIFHPLLALIASASDNELARYVEYLKEENKILRARIPGQIHTKPEERKRLLRLGKPLGRAIEELITIVSPKTFYRWCRDNSGQTTTKNAKGGQRKPEEIRKLVIEIANTTGFGYTRILGELRKIGIKKISRQTVRNILKEEGIEPGPDRTSDSWTTFLERHKETLWGCDFFSVKAVTATGLRELYLLVFLCMETREVFVSPSTEHPNSSWVCQQTQRFIDDTSNRAEKKPDIIMHDRDTKFSKDFVATIKKNGLRANALPKASPNLNGRTERFVGQIKQECLSKFILFGKRHLDYIVSEYVDYFNQQRAHSSRSNLPPLAAPPEEIATLTMDQVEVKSYVGGLIKSFERKVA
jgi:putative transposase